MATKAELVFIPSPGAGHLISAIEMAKLILIRDERLCISVLIMKLPLDLGIQPYIQYLSSTPQPRLQFVDITIDDETASGFLSNKDTFFINFIPAHKPKVIDFVHSTSFSKSTPGSNSQLAGFVLDMFCTSMMDVANELCVPSYIFFTSNAAFLALSFHFESLKKEHHMDTSKYRDSDEELIIPGFVNPYPTKYLPKLATDQTEATTMFFDSVTRFKKTRGILINTFVELEPFALQSLSVSVPKIYPVGPVVNLKEEGHGRNSQSEIESIILWLDDQPESSVVFLCFGSMGSLDTEQVKQIAAALEPPPKGIIELPSNYENVEEVLPEGFLERTNSVGKVIGWAPQVAILCHPSLGGFVSHCGWNSVLESLSFGVPIASWPLYAEQQMNAFELVKELGLAVEIRMDYFKDFEGKYKPDLIVGAKEIESGIRQLMNQNEIRKKAKEMKDKSSAAMMEGGSSYASLGLLIEDVISNIS
ncbi:unnamed protein product [Withania somnifera]